MITRVMVSTNNFIDTLFLIYLYFLFIFIWHNIEQDLLKQDIYHIIFIKEIVCYQR